jgi:hypothetical protein
MPNVDDFSRVQAVPDAPPPISEVVAAARHARAAALRAWMAAAWCVLTGRRGTARASDAAGRPREAKIKNREDLPMRRRHHEAYVLPHQID